MSLPSPSLTVLGLLPTLAAYRCASLSMAIRSGLSSTISFVISAFQPFASASFTTD